MYEFERPAPDTLRIERRLATDRETLWRWLTDPELRRRWFMAGPLDARPGGTIGFTVAHENLSDGEVAYPDRYAAMRGHSFTETVTVWDPPHRLGFSWDGGKEGAVLFELFEDGDATRLVLTHSGITGPAPMTNFAGGWLSHLAVLEARLAGHGVADFWAIHCEAEAEAQARLAQVQTP